MAPRAARARSGAGEIHGFRCIGEEPLVQVGIHLSPRLLQENLEAARFDSRRRLSHPVSFRQTFARDRRTTPAESKAWACRKSMSRD